MSRTHSVSVNQPGSKRHGQFRRPTSKQLDLLLLAGCSCLMTVLYHPVAEALQTSHVANGPTTAIATRTSQSSPNSLTAFHLTLPPARDEVQTEDEA